MKLRSIPVMLVLLFVPRAVFSQQAPTADPGAIQKHDKDTLQYFELERKLDQFRQQPGADIIQKTRQQASKRSADNATRFLLQNVRMNPSELLKPAEIRAILSEYEGRKVSLADLDRMVLQINQLYERKGYKTARAILPTQRITNGEVRVTLVEGHVGAIEIANKTRTRDSYILKRVRLKPGELLRVDELQRNLAFLNNTSDIKVKAVLAPGASFGTSNVDLHAEEPQNQRSMLLFDNAGRDGVGNNRLGFVERYASVLGLRDPFMLGVYWAAGTLDAFTSYNVPLNSRDTRLGFNVDYDRIRIVSGTGAHFGIAGTSMDTGLRLYQPLWESSRGQWNLSFATDYIKSRLESQHLPLSDTMVHSYGLTSSEQILDRHGLLSTNQTITLGVHNLGGTRSFLKFNASVIRIQDLTRGMVGVVRLTCQTNAWNYLPPVEQFQAGGTATVRGYPEGRQIGDRGYAGSAEIQIPPPFPQHMIHGARFGQKLKEAFFFDNGAVYDSYRKVTRAPGEDRELTSAGSGLILNFSKYFSGRVDVAFPLRNTEKIPHCRVQFYFQSSPPLAAALWKTARAWWGPW